MNTKSLVIMHIVAISTLIGVTAYLSVPFDVRDDLNKKMKNMMKKEKNCLMDKLD